jgi:hypothetical protein
MIIKSFLLITSLSACLSTVQAGQLDFWNFDPPDARAHFGNIYLGNNYVAELFWAPGVTSNPYDLLYVPSADTLFLGVTGGDPQTTDAGYFFGGSVYLPATGVVTIAIDVDELGGAPGPNIRGVYDGGVWAPPGHDGDGFLGLFTVNGRELFQVTLPADPPEPPAAMPADLQWIVLAPEPSSLVLMLTALVPLLFRRCRTLAS